MRNIFREILHTQMSRQNTVIIRLADKLKIPAEELMDIVEGRKVPTLPQYYAIGFELKTYETDLQEQLVKQLKSAMDALVIYDLIELAAHIEKKYNL